VEWVAFQLIALGVRYGALHTQGLPRGEPYRSRQADYYWQGGQRGMIQVRFSFPRTIGPIIGARRFEIIRVAVTSQSPQDTGYQICFAAYLVQVRIETVRRGSKLMGQAIVHDRTHAYLIAYSPTHNTRTHRGYSKLSHSKKKKARSDAIRYDTERRSIVENVEKRARYAAILHATPQACQVTFKIVQVVIL